MDLSRLRASFGGTIVTPFDPAYEGTRVLFNNRVATRPAVICQCGDTSDVVAAVRFARDAGLPLSVRGGGHHACGFSLVDGGLVVDTRTMKRIAFDPLAATVVAGPGSGWRALDRVTYHQQGLAAPGGECPTVSNAGYSLGGGFGFLSRTFGLACDHILEARVVDATGRVLQATENENPDLYWALRGAGGAGFGVVTSLKYRLDPVPPMVFGGVLAWSLDDAPAAFAAYRDFYEGRDEDRMSLYLALVTDPYPEGDPVLMAYGMYAGPLDDGPAQLAALRAVGKPVFDTFGPISYFDLQDTLGQEIVYGLQLKWRGGFFRDGGFGDEAFAAIVDSFRSAPSGFSMCRFDLLGGGAISAVPPDATAFVHRSSLFNISIIAQWVRDDEAEANLRWVDDLMTALNPHLNGEVYQNYADEDLGDWPTAYYGANYPRLQEVKRAYDPEDVFHHPQSIRVH
jgi:FAD/FMN-containing dehydrogenase